MDIATIMRLLLLRILCWTRAAEDVALDAAETVVDTVAEVVNIVADDGGMLFTLQNEVTNNQAAEIRDKSDDT